MTVEVLPLIPGERAWRAADRAAGATAPAQPRDWSRPAAEFDAQHEEYWRRVRTAPSDRWAEIDEAAYWEALEMLPPIRVPGGFLVSEPMTEDPQGRTVFLCVVTRNGRHFAGYRVKDRVAESLP